MSVRSLVEFIYRYGDIDNRAGASGEEVMLQGARIHRKVQSLAGAGYRAEYSLSYTFNTRYCEVTIDGRADGLITDDEGVTIDEIKTTGKNPSGMTEPDPVHLAQAMCYAAIYLIQEELESVGVRMTYVNRETEDIGYFNYIYSAEEIMAWFDETLAEMGRWLDMQAAWVQERQESIKDLEFPFEYRPGQKELAGHVYRTIYHGRKLFIEAPTGTGKTLSVLYPTIKSIGENRGDRIFYLTARTIARTVAEDAVKTLRAGGLRLKSVSLTAREKICFMDEADCNPEYCPYAKGHFDRINECLFEMVSGEEYYPREKIEEYALRYRVCPFELSLDASLYSDCIICDYNYVFDPNAYLRRFFAEGSDGDYIFLVDEAHNLVDRGREMYSAQLVKEDLMTVRRLCAGAQPRIARAIEKCNRALNAMKKARSGEDKDTLVVMPGPGEIIGHLDMLRTIISDYLSLHRDGIAHSEILDLYFKVCDFLNIYDLYGQGYLTYNAFNDDGSFFLKLMCVDPSVNLGNMMGHARSTVLFSATLLPIQYYKALLGGTSEDYEVYASSVFDTDNRLLIQATDVTTRYAARSHDQYARMAEYIHRITVSHPGNYMVFAPSYGYMTQVSDIYLEEYGDEGRDVLIQSNRMKESEREEFLEHFKEDNGRGALGFCVLGGIFAEGIDLKDDALIGVIIMGTGLPQIGGERDLIRRYFDENGEKGYDYAYSYPGMNRVQQAAGRLIRTETDTGVIALLDERFSWPSNRRMFPREWSDITEVKTETVTAYLEDFWSSVSDLQTPVSPL